MKHFILGLAVLASFTANAGQDGNGGDVITCPNVKEATLLDFQEGKRRGFAIDLGTPNLSLREKVSIYLKRIERLTPVRAKIYREEAEKMLVDIEKYQATGENLQQNILFTEEEQVDIPDSDHRMIPPNCKIEQIAVQRLPQFDEDRFYTINIGLWKRLNQDHKAGLIMHEVIFKELIEHGHPNSVTARYLNTLFASKKSETMTLEQYVEVGRKADIKYTDYMGILLRVDKFVKDQPSSIGMWDSNRVRYGWPYGHQKGFSKQEPAFITVLDQKVAAETESNIGFHKNGKLAFFSLDNISIPPNSACVELAELMKKYPRCGNSDTQFNHLFLKHADYKIAATGTIIFYPNGNIAQANVREAMIQNGGIESYTTIFFKENQELMAIYGYLYKFWAGATEAVSLLINPSEITVTQLDSLIDQKENRLTPIVRLLNPTYRDVRALSENASNKYNATEISVVPAAEVRPGFSLCQKLGLDQDLQIGGPNAGEGKNEVTGFEVRKDGSIAAVKASDKGFGNGGNPRLITESYCVHTPFSFLQLFNQ